MTERQSQNKAVNRANPNKVDGRSNIADNGKRTEVIWKAKVVEL